MAEASAGFQGHDLLKPRFGPFYAQAVNGSSFRYRIAPRTRAYGRSEALACQTVFRGGLATPMALAGYVSSSSTVPSSSHL